MYKKTFSKKDVYQMVNDKVLSMLESGESFKWIKSWKGSPDADWNYNYNSKRAYGWLNNFMLDYDRAVHGYSSNGWLTALQMKQMGIHWSGKSASYVVFFTMLHFNDAGEKGGESELSEKTVPFLRYTPVWNLDQTDVKVEEKPEVLEPVEQTEADALILDYVARENIRLKHGGNRACYMPYADTIKMPKKEDFTGESEFYSTLFHECVHSTGHRNRLDRINMVHFADREEYSKEELVAEIGASYLCAVFGYFEQTKENNVAYLQAWANIIKENKKWLVSAFGKAEKAVAMIMNEKGGSDVSERK